MNIELTARINGEFFRGGGAIEVKESMKVAFEPLKTCDDGLVAYATGDRLSETTEVRRIIKLRKDAAKEMAEALTILILNEMQKNDTVNGYPVEKSHAFRV